MEYALIHQLQQLPAEIIKQALIRFLVEVEVKPAVVHVTDSSPEQRAEAFREWAERSSNPSSSHFSNVITTREDLYDDDRLSWTI